MDKNLKPQEVAWNLSEALILEIGTHLKQASMFYIKDNLELALYSLKAIRQRIIQSLDEIERKTTSEKEIEIQKLCSSYKLMMNNRGFDNLGQSYIELRNKMFLVYEEYNTILMDLLEKYGYLVQKKEDKTNLNA